MKGIFMKKILNRLFSRMAITVFLVIIQLAVMVLGIIFLQDRYIYVAGALKLLSVVVVLYIITKDGNPMAKMAWMVFILLFPILGGLMYILFGHVFMSRRLKKNMLKVYQQEIYENVKGDNCCDSEELRREPVYRISKYMEEVGGAAIYKNTKVKYYAMADDVMEDLLNDLKSAKKYIFMEYFIVDKGEMWDAILEVLKEKAKEGLDVRFMYDDIGSVFNVPKYYWKEIESYGIKCMAFNQVVPFMATIFNNRDHRKITVVDGKIAHTGGYNIADEYINKKQRFGVWKDSGVRLEGEGAWSFTVMFLQLWNSFRYSEGSFAKYKVEEDFSNIEDGYVQPYKTNPLARENVGENLYIQMINDARDYIYIFTPYLIVCNELMTALKLAGKRGVDVRIVTPAIPDKKYIYEMTKSSYSELITAGVRIYQYTPGFIHSKTLLVDDSLASVGSINFDNRSFDHHFECGTLFYKSEAIADVKRDMSDTFAASEEVDLLWCRRNTSKVSIRGAVLRLLSPLL
jgi:cardiolipin synthase